MFTKVIKIDTLGKRGDLKNPLRTIYSGKDVEYRVLAYTDNDTKAIILVGAPDQAKLDAAIGEVTTHANSSKKVYQIYHISETDRETITDSSDATSIGKKFKDR